MAQLALHHVAGTCRFVAAACGETHDLHRIADRRQRVAQLVRQHRQELALAPVGPRQLGGALAQLVGHDALLGDVGVGTQPALYLTLGVLDRHGARQEPAVAAVAGTQLEGVLEHVAAGSRLPRAFDHPRHVLGVQHARPVRLQHRFGRHAGVVEPALVVPIDVAARIGRPGELRHVVGQGAEAFLAVLQGDVDALGRGDVFEGQEDAFSLALWVDDAARR